MPGLEPQEIYDSDSDDDEVPPLSLMRHEENYSSDSDSEKDSVPDLDLDDNSDNESEALDLLEPEDSDDSKSEMSEGSNLFDCEFSGEEYREVLQIMFNLNNRRFIVPELEEGVIASNKHKVEIVSNPKIATNTPWKCEKYQHYFLGVGNNKIKKTFSATTQYAPTRILHTRPGTSRNLQFLGL